MHEGTSFFRNNKFFPKTRLNKWLVRVTSKKFIRSSYATTCSVICASLEQDRTETTAAFVYKNNRIGPRTIGNIRRQKNAHLFCSFHCFEIWPGFVDTRTELPRHLFQLERILCHERAIFGSCVLQRFIWKKLYISQQKPTYRIYSSISRIFCTKNLRKKSGATYTRGVTWACTLLLCACYLDGALHLHTCACDGNRKKNSKAN